MCQEIFREIVVFYENFERVCKERNISPSRACIEAGMRANRAANWKTSGALPKQEELQSLADVLNCDVADFFRSRTGAKFHTAYDALMYQELEEQRRRYAEGLTDIDPDPDPMYDVEDTILVEAESDEGYVVSLMHRMSRRQIHDFMELVFDFADRNGLSEEDEKR